MLMKESGEYGAGYEPYPMSSADELRASGIVETLRLRLSDEMRFRQKMRKCRLARQAMQKEYSSGEPNGRLWDNTLLQRHERRAQDGRAWFTRPSSENTDANERFTRRTFLRLSGAAAIWAGGVWYGYDVHETRERQANTKSYILPVYEGKTDDANGKFLKVTAGFGNLNSYPTAHAVPKLADYYNVGATVLDAQGIDTDVLKERSEAFMGERGLDRISYAGYSMGGLISLSEARKMYESDNGIELDTIYLHCTPIDADALWPDVQAQGVTLMKLLSSIPGATDSQILRYIVETFGARWKEIIFPSWAGSGTTVSDMIRRGEKVSDYVLDTKIFNDDAASNALIRAQINMILASGARDDIAALGVDSPHGKKKPIIVYIRPLDNSADTTVNNDVSAAEFEKVCSDADLTFIDVKADGIHHADPIQSSEVHNLIAKIIEEVKNNKNFAYGDHTHGNQEIYVSVRKQHKV